MEEPEPMLCRTLIPLAFPVSVTVPVGKSELDAGTRYRLKLYGSPSYSVNDGGRRPGRDDS